MILLQSGPNIRGVRVSVFSLFCIRNLDVCQWGERGGNSKFCSNEQCGRGGWSGGVRRVEKSLCLAGWFSFASRSAGLQFLYNWEIRRSSVQPLPFGSALARSSLTLTLPSPSLHRLFYSSRSCWTWINLLDVFTSTSTFSFSPHYFYWIKQSNQLISHSISLRYFLLLKRANIYRLGFCHSLFLFRNFTLFNIEIKQFIMKNTVFLENFFLENCFFTEQCWYKFVFIV